MVKEEILHLAHLGLKMRFIIMTIFTVILSIYKS